jgi:hypothetical protein
MAAHEPLLIAKLRAAKDISKAPWLVPQDTFPMLVNAREQRRFERVVGPHLETTRVRLPNMGISEARYKGIPRSWSMSGPFRIFCSAVEMPRQRPVVCICRWAARRLRQRCPQDLSPDQRHYPRRTLQLHALLSSLSYLQSLGLIVLIWTKVLHTYANRIRLTLDPNILAAIWAMRSA